MPCIHDYMAKEDMADLWADHMQRVRDEECARYGHDFRPAALSESGEPVTGRVCFCCGLPEKLPEPPAQGGV